MINRIKALTSNQAVRGTVTVSAGIFIGSIFAYFIQIFLGRNLTVEEYGIFNSLFSLSVIIGILSSTFITSIIKAVSDLKVKSKFDTLTHLYINLSAGSLLLGISVALVIFLLRNFLADFLNISDIGILVSFSALMSIAFLRITPFAYLQGLLRFKAFAFAQVFSNVLRLGVTVAAVLIGYRVGGIFIAMGMGGIVGFVVCTALLKKNFEKFERVTLSKHYKRIFTFAGPVLFVQIGMILLNNMDILLVKHYFDGYSAGLYSGLVTVGKVFLFAANTVAVVMFPQISNAFAKREDYIARFKPFLYLQIFVILAGLAIFSTFPGLITKIMFGRAYLPVVPYLPKFTVFFALYVMINFMTLFLLAIEKTRVFLLQIPMVLVQAVLIAFFHSSISSVVNVNLVVAGCLLVFIVVYALKSNQYST